MASRMAASTPGEASAGTSAAEALQRPGRRSDVAPATRTPGASASPRSALKGPPPITRSSACGSARRTSGSTRVASRRAASRCVGRARLPAKMSRVGSPARRKS